MKLEAKHSPQLHTCNCLWGFFNHREEVVGDPYPSSCGPPSWLALSHAVPLKLTFTLAVAMEPWSSFLSQLCKTQPKALGAPGGGQLQALGVGRWRSWSCGWGACFTLTSTARGKQKPWEIPAVYAALAIACEVQKLLVTHLGRHKQKWSSR